MVEVIDIKTKNSIQLSNLEKYPHKMQAIEINSHFQKYHSWDVIKFIWFTSLFNSFKNFKSENKFFRFKASF